MASNLTAAAAKLDNVYSWEWKFVSGRGEHGWASDATVPNWLTGSYNDEDEQGWHSKRTEKCMSLITSKLCQSAQFSALKSTLHKIGTFFRATKILTTCIILQERTVIMRDAWLKETTDKVQNKKLTAFKIYKRGK